MASIFGIVRELESGLIVLKKRASWRSALISSASALPSRPKVVSKTFKKPFEPNSPKRTAKENIGALYSGTGVGKLQDAIGGEVGNNENITARNTIDGLSMKALMDMISMSDVSAKAMDSDAEMKAWLEAIKDDNYEAAMAKLHALDISFGGGDLMRKMFEEGVLDRSTYQFITNRAQTDPATESVIKTIRRYEGLSGAVGSDNMTLEERSELDELRANGLRTLHGLHMHGFPNAFMIQMNQGANMASNIPHNIVDHAATVAQVVSHAEANGFGSVEPTQEAEAAWVELILTNQGSLIGSTECTPGFWNNEGQGWSQEFRQAQGHPGGAQGYFKHIQAWREAGDFEGLVFIAAPTKDAVPAHAELVS